AEDQILETYIRNLPTPPSPLIKPYLRDVGFLHVAIMGKGCKLDPTLVSALVERWRPEMHTFYLPCGKCTITLEDVQLQLGLPVDRPVVTGSIYAVNWRDVCEQLLGRVSEMIYRAWIDMNWLRRNFGGLNEDSSEVQREQHVRAYILMIIGGLLMPDKSRNFLEVNRVDNVIPEDVSGDGTTKNSNRWLYAAIAIIGVVLATIFTSSSRLPLYILTRNKNHELSYVRLPDKRRYIRLLLDQRLEANVKLVVYATVEMHESDSVAVIRVYAIDFAGTLRHRRSTSYRLFLPTPKAIIAQKLTCDLKYMSQFRVHGKPYLLAEEVKDRQPHTRRP
ncbi:hypothetical protein Gotur_005300, partial [Gossypium turneri]